MKMTTLKYIELVRAGKSDEEISEMIKTTEKIYLGQSTADEVAEAAKNGDIAKLEALRAKLDETDENWWAVSVGLGLVGADIFFRSRGSMKKALPELQQAASVPRAQHTAAVRGVVEQLELDLGSAAGPRAGRTAAEVQGAAGTRFGAFVPPSRRGGATGGAASAATTAAQAATATTAGKRILSMAGTIGKWGGTTLSILNAGNFLYEVGLLTSVGFGDYEKNRQKYLSGNLGAPKFGPLGGTGMWGFTDMAMGPNREELEAQQGTEQEIAGKLADARRKDFVKLTGYQGAREIEELSLGEVDIGVQKEFRAADRAEQEKYLREFVVSKLGYLPMDYEAVKATFMPDQPQFVETEYGTFYKGKADDAWQPYKQQAASLQDLRKEYTGVYGTPDGNRGFKPIRLEGGVSIAGVFKGTDGMLKDFDSGVRLASEARIALASLRKLIQDNPVGKSFSPSLRKEALTLINRIKPAMRVDIVGVGTVSNFEQEILNQSLTNPTDFLSFDDATLRQIELTQQQFDRGLRNQGRLYGLEISLSDPLGLDRTQQIREAKLRRRANQSPQ